MEKTFNGLKIENEFYSRDMPWHVPTLGLVKIILNNPRNNDKFAAK
jgi:hypothetical protein